LVPPRLPGDEATAPQPGAPVVSKVLHVLLLIAIGGLLAAPA
jgi:hypothetical protein